MLTSHFLSVRRSIVGNISLHREASGNSYHKRISLWNPHSWIWGQAQSSEVQGDLWYSLRTGWENAVHITVFQVTLNLCFKKCPADIYFPKDFSTVIIWWDSWPRKIVWNICIYFSVVTEKATILALLTQGHAFTEMMVGTFITSLQLPCWQDKAEFPSRSNEVLKSSVDSQVYSAIKEGTLLSWWMVHWIYCNAALWKEHTP